MEPWCTGLENGSDVKENCLEIIVKNKMLCRKLPIAVQKLLQRR